MNATMILQNIMLAMLTIIALTILGYCIRKVKNDIPNNK